MHRRFAAVLVLATFLSLAACDEQASVSTSSQTASGMQLLNQNWDDRQREAAWYTSFGSRIIPLSWFLALEDADSELRFSRTDNLQRFGFATAGTSPANPYGLPIGVTVTPVHQGRRWVGLGCSGCHSGQVYYRGETLHIDGDQALIDFQLFEGELVSALQATLADDDKFRRFADALNRAPADSGSGVDLKQVLEAETKRLNDLATLNKTSVAYGRGRLDAFGQIFNAVAADFLGIPGNRREPDAPTSYPMLWGASHLDLVQWNGSAPNDGPGPLVQNATTALAVFGELDIHSSGIGYHSSVEIENLGLIQDLWYRLDAPAWPEQTLGAIDRPLAERGSRIYQAQCVSCHQLAQEHDGKRELKATLVPVDTVGTDPTMARNFTHAKAESGAFEGEKLLFFMGPKLEANTYTINLVVHAAFGALLEHPWRSFKAGLYSLHKVLSAPLHERPYTYKARPLSGIWASAPYLHNGSVPTLAGMLSTQRPSRFPVGKVEYDPQRVGLSDKVLDATQVSDFDTQAPGNANGGHRYGTELAEEDKRALIEYLKTL